MKKYGKEMVDFKLFDTDALTNRLAKAGNTLNDKFDENTRKAKEFTNKFDEGFQEGFERNRNNAQEMLRPAANMVRNMVKDWNRAGKGGGFHRGGDVKLEGAQSTYDRILQEMANPTMAGVEIEKAQLEQQKKMNENLIMIGGNMKGFQNPGPAVVN